MIFGINKSKGNGGSYKKGFTLIELLISIVIFMIFLGIVSQSYLSIVRSQRQSNEIRKMYSDVRVVMEIISEEVRLSAIDYDCYGSSMAIVSSYSLVDTGCGGVSGTTISDGRTDTLLLLRKGGQEKTVIKWDNVSKHLYMTKYVKTTTGSWQTQSGYEDPVLIASEKINFDYVSFAIFPSVNPYEAYWNNVVQFQPKVTLFMTVKNGENVNVPFDFDFQTSVSSRVYSKKI